MRFRDAATTRLRDYATTKGAKDAKDAKGVKSLCGVGEWGGGERDLVAPSIGGICRFAA